MPNGIGPFIVFAAGDNQFKFIDDLCDAQLSGNDNDPRYCLAGFQEIRYMLRHSPPIMCEDNTLLFCRPDKEFLIRRITQFNLMRCDSIDIRNTPHKSTYNILIKILINK